ncbi:MAG: ParB/RepB/Spo0J family partition protein [Acidobacteriaceae bacterium]|jgi:ParB family chromosome partitioning protein
METVNIHAETKKRAALGKGIDSLLGARVQAPAAAVEGTGRPLEIELERIERNPHQTRTSFDEGSLEELANSIKATGVMQPVTVREIGGGRYQLIMGERRWRASKLAGKATIPALVRQANDEQVMEMTIIENLQREDLNPMEEARAFDQLRTVFSMTQDQMAVRTGKTRASVSNIVRLLNLPAALQVFVESGKLTAGHAMEVLRLHPSGTDAMVSAGLRIAGMELTVRQAAGFVDDLMAGRKGMTEKPAAKERVVDPNVRAAEQKLREKLGLRVQIDDKGGKGRVVIGYSGVEEFDRILEALGE